MRMGQERGGSAPTYLPHPWAQQVQCGRRLSAQEQQGPGSTGATEELMSPHPQCHQHPQGHQSLFHTPGLTHLQLHLPIPTGSALPTGQPCPQADPAHQRLACSRSQPTEAGFAPRASSAMRPAERLAQGEVMAGSQGQLTGEIQWMAAQLCPPSIGRQQGGHSPPLCAVGLGALEAHPDPHTVTLPGPRRTTQLHQVMS